MVNLPTQVPVGPLHLFFPDTVQSSFFAQVLAVHVFETVASHWPCLLHVVFPEIWEQSGENVPICVQAKN